MIDQLREELEADEGNVKSVYLCSEKKLTVGIGHLCREGEPEYDMEVGTPISDERVAELFEKDVGWTIKDCYKLIPDFDMLPEEVRLIFANMMFNLGMKNLGLFKRFFAAIEDRDWQKAADEMYDSKWRRQVPNRAGRLIERMRQVI
jgi:lysozyme